MDLKERGRRSGAAVQQGNGHKRSQWSRTRVTVDEKYLKNSPNKMKQERSEYDQVIRCLRRSTLNPERDVDDYRRRISERQSGSGIDADAGSELAVWQAQASTHLANHQDRRQN